MVLATLLFIVGLIALIGGALLLVSGASKIATTLKVSPLIIGLTIVSFGTSAPEIAVSASGAWRGAGGLVIGNVVGSNILNIFLVLGLGAVISPLFVKKKLIQFDVPLLIVISLVFWLFAWKGIITRWMGIILFAGIIGYLAFAFHLVKKEPEQKKKIPSPSPLWWQIAQVLIGIFLLGLGADLLIKNAITLARLLKISELFIGLTIVALGTSLPEIATSVVAIMKREHDIVVGNVVGSNILTY